MVVAYAELAMKRNQEKQQEEDMVKSRVLTNHQLVQAESRLLEEDWKHRDHKLAAVKRQQWC